MDIVQLTNESPDFYPLIGPFLARRHVDEAYGGRMWNEDGMIWFVALTETREVLGFSALSPKEFELRLCNDYIRPEYRLQERGIQSALLDCMIEACPANAVLIVTANPDERDYYEARGFTYRRAKGRFPVLAKIIEKGEA